MSPHRHTPPQPAPSLIRARLAVAALFFTNGALFANLAPRYPEVKEALGLGNSSYGLALAAFSAGALCAGLGAGALIRKFGSARVAVVGTLLTAVGVLLAGFAPNVGFFAVALFFGGSMDAITDVGQNAHGLQVQRRFGRSIINSFHAVWSIGAVTGGAMAAAAIVLGLPLGVHLTISGAVFSLVAVIAARYCLSATDSGQQSPAASPKSPVSPEPAELPVSTAAPTAAVDIDTAGTFRLRWRLGTAGVLAALVLIATASAIVEDMGSSWAALYLRTELAALPAVGAAGFISVLGAQCIGRLVGDRMVDRFGQRTVVRAGGLLVAVGMALALGWPTVPGTLLGFAAAGFGVATFVPAAMERADELPGLAPGTGLTVVSWLMRIGFLLSPPMIGAIADAAGLRAGLMIVPVAGLVAAMLAGVLRPRRPRVSDDFVGGAS